MILLNLHGKEPINEQIQHQIIRYISLGIMKKNEKLPSVRDLANELGINPNTVMKAYQNLEADGYIYMLSKKGAFIADRNAEISNETLDKIKDIIYEAKRENIKYDEIFNLVKEVYDVRD